MERTTSKQKEPASFGIGPDGVKVSLLRSDYIKSNIRKANSRINSYLTYGAVGTAVTGICAFSISLGHNTNSKAAVSLLTVAAAADTAVMFYIAYMNKKAKTSLEGELQEHLRKG
jgi:hypothetical protein